MNAWGARRFVRLGLFVLSLPTLFALGDAARIPAPPPAAGGDDLAGEGLDDGFWDAVGFADGFGDAGD